MYLHLLKRYISEGDLQSRTPHHDAHPNVVIPLCGQFKGERGESCQVIPLAETKKLGVNIRQVINLLIAVQYEKNSPQVPWNFFGK